MQVLCAALVERCNYALGVVSEQDKLFIPQVEFDPSLLTLHRIILYKGDDGTVMLAQILRVHENSEFTLLLEDGSTLRSTLSKANARITELDTNLSYTLEETMLDPDSLGECTQFNWFYSRFDDAICMRRLSSDKEERPNIVCFNAKYGSEKVKWYCHVPESPNEDNMIDSYMHKDGFYTAKYSFDPQIVINLCLLRDHDYQFGRPMDNFIGTVDPSDTQQIQDTRYMCRAIESYHDDYFTIKQFLRSWAFNTYEAVDFMKTTFDEMKSGFEDWDLFQQALCYAFGVDDCSDVTLDTLITYASDLKRRIASRNEQRRTPRLSISILKDAAGRELTGIDVESTVNIHGFELSYDAVMDVLHSGDVIFIRKAAQNYIAVVTKVERYYPSSEKAPCTRLFFTMGDDVQYCTNDYRHIIIPDFQKLDQEITRVSLSDEGIETMKRLFKL